ncbi:hypothetical protein [Pyrodictium abyssi]|uniref:hypothetical protein n=1 Tax=Pyrodictium abyssi TaxID=54256 RepID=UPI0030C68B92
MDHRKRVEAKTCIFLQALQEASRDNTVDPRVIGLGGFRIICYEKPAKNMLEPVQYGKQRQLLYSVDARLQLLCHSLGDASLGTS